MLVGKSYTKIMDDLTEAIECARRIKEKLDSLHYNYKYIWVVDEDGKQKWAGKHT